MSASAAVTSTTTTPRPHRGSTRDAVAVAFRRRVETIDRVARLLISTSGALIICAVLGIGFFLLLEILPLFSGARVGAPDSHTLPPAVATPHLVLVDEYQEKALVLGDEPALYLLTLDRAAPTERLPLDGLEARQISCAAFDAERSTVAVGTSQGSVGRGALGLRTTFQGSQRAIRPFVEPLALVEVAPGRRITAVASRATDDREVTAAVIEEALVSVVRTTLTHPLVGPAQRTSDTSVLPMEGVGTPRLVLVDEAATQALVGTSEGFLVRWRLPAAGPPEILESVKVVPDGAVTAMSYLLGGRSVAVGGSDGSLATWSLIRDEQRPDGHRLVRFHHFPSHPDSVERIAPSPRDKGFLSASADGTLRLQHMTTERLLASWPLGAPPAALVIAPKANGVLGIGADGTLRRWRIDNPHPDVSWRALFRPVWYEGYEGPAYIWQSHGGTDDFEPKFSLVPLIFGTLKGTVYALLFAVPLALFGALYCSQFLDKRLRAPIKSLIELMAALPSVVLGFIAGIILAPFVQRHVVSVLLLPAAVLVLMLGGMTVAWRLPVSRAQAWVRRHEFLTLTAMVALGVGVSLWLGPWLERGWFHGHFEAWLLHATGTRYDQRNALVVGWTMGFAVIPVIFTICEDAFSAVPPTLTAASLACGASLWQTARRIILPAAGSGVFSAVMIGFGRAVGETMIVLMATGNTPIMDWTIFNGFRALSANIAVEIPEAPYGSTHYRVLFVAALLLFVMTFIVNTGAELIRMRLRRRLQGL